MSIEKTLEALRQVSAEPDISNSSISNWSVGKQIQHCCLVMIAIFEQIKNSVPPPPPKKFSIARIFVFLTGIMPRGRGKAPEKTLPEKKLSSQELCDLLDRAEKSIKEMRELDRNKWFDHFVFSILNRDESLKLIKIHNRHHLKIIHEILNTQK